MSIEEIFLNLGAWAALFMLISVTVFVAETGYSLFKLILKQLDKKNKKD